ncbi:hypothetical protein GIB67_019231 [Kingdonia uniflora]|uniref:Uncharacterized protein n=1 Tax=Kingdonia uniflora TaxID=39325 RepID=A0A7J7N0D7_9MAGN|nr:hypothetical protein GIB67_019231 [Kingdonia uniflora]
MLLRKKNSSKVLCRKLELNIDDTYPTKYYVCYDFLCDKYMSRQHKCAYFSYSNNANCGCRKLMNIETFLSNKKAVDNGSVDGVFVKGIVFMVTDDLQIMPIGTETCFTHLKSLGIKGRDLLDEQVVHVGVDEVKSKDTASAETIKIDLKLTIIKAKNKIMYAEAGKDFIALSSVSLHSLLGPW